MTKPPDDDQAVLTIVQFGLIRFRLKILERMEQHKSLTGKYRILNPGWRA